MQKVVQIAQQAHLNQQKIVLVTGVFDLLHQEHKKFLQKAKAVGDILLVGIEADARVKALKGAARPIYKQNKRLKQLRALPVIDHVFILPEKFITPQDHYSLLQLIKPQILAVSSHTPFLAQKQNLMKQVGGEVQIIHEHNPAVSTTKLIKK